jgi:hypothetical protein
MGGTCLGLPSSTSVRQVVSLLLLARRDDLPSEHASLVVVNSVRVGSCWPSFLHLYDGRRVCTYVISTCVCVLPTTPSSFLTSCHDGCHTTQPHPYDQLNATRHYVVWCVRTFCRAVLLALLLTLDWKRGPSLSRSDTCPRSQDAQHHDQDPQVRDTTRPARARLPLELCACTRVCAVICTHSCPPSPLNRLARARR